jgi:VanZ family protein
MPRQASTSATPLALAWAVLIGYASLYPLSDWHHPQGLWSLAFLNLPWPRWWDRFDIVANLVGYLPLGVFVYFAAAQRGCGRRAAVLAGVLLPALLSAMLEMAQNFLPQRVPSALDLALNSAGAAIGALLAAAADAAGFMRGWRAWRRRWFVETPSAAATGLLLLWPIGLLFPAPVPFALGQVWPRLADAAEVLSGWIEGVPWAAQWVPQLPALEAPSTPLSAMAETALTVFGLLAPCLLAFTITRPTWRRLVLVAGAGLAGFAVATFSTALNFGPEHALAWIAPTTLPAIGIALLLSALVSRVPRRAAAALALVAATGLIVLSAQAPADPYFADSLQAWEQGRFIRFHGLAQWVGWLWPFALLTHLLRRVGAREEGSS